MKRKRKKKKPWHEKVLWGLALFWLLVFVFYIVMSIHSQMQMSRLSQQSPPPEATPVVR